MAARMRHRLPDGGLTLSDKKYVDAWEKVGTWLVENFFPGHYCAGFDPGVTLHACGDWGPHQGVSLRMPTIIALAYSDAAGKLDDSIKHLLPKETRPSIQATGYRHTDRACRLILGDEVYLRGTGFDKQGHIRWYKCLVIERIYTPYGSHAGYLVARNNQRIMVSLNNYGIEWSVHPHDHFLHVKASAPPFKVTRGPWK